MSLNLLKYVYVLLTIESEFSVTEERLEQSEKAHFPMLVTLLGIVTFVNPVQPENALAPMLVTLSPSIIDVRLLQPKKE